MITLRDSILKTKEESFALLSYQKRYLVYQQYMNSQQEILLFLNLDFHVDNELAQIMKLNNPRFNNEQDDQ